MARPIKDAAYWRAWATRNREAAQPPVRRDPVVQVVKGADSDQLKQEALTDPAKFAEWPLGLMVPAHHADWYRLSQMYKVDARYTKLLILAPTGWGKTTAFNLALPIFEMAADRSIQIGMIGNNQINERQKLRVLSQTVTENRDLVQGFGYRGEDGVPRFRPKGKEIKWTVDEIQIAGAAEESVRRNKVMSDPTVAVFGWETKMEGRHWDLAIPDDVVEYREAQSPLVREQQLDWYINVFKRRMKAGGREFWIGTRSHHADLYQYLIESGEYFVIDDPQALVMQDGVEVSSWPEAYPTAMLLTERAKDPISFMLKRENKIAGQGLTEFARNDILACRDDSLSYYGNRQNMPSELRAKNLVFYMGVDLATGLTMESAYFVVYVAAADLDTGDRYLLHLVRKKMGTTEQKNAVIEAAGLWVPTKIMVENNGVQRYFYEDSFGGLPVFGCNTSSNKVDLGEGIPSLVSLVKNRKLHIPWGTAQDQSISGPFLKELEDYPKGATNDIVMAFWFTEREIRTRFLAAIKTQTDRNFFRRSPYLIQHRSAGGFYRHGP